jgi:hypothetical protein
MADSAEFEFAWPFIRLLRASPPGLATEDQRRLTFSAALDQAEELWRAAGLVAPTARPIVLFYALAQGALAISASRISGPEWEGIPGHGLRLPKPDAANNDSPQLSAVFVRSQGNGFVQQIAGLLNSPVLEHMASMSELLSSLPEHRELLLINSLDPRPLHIADSTVHMRPDGAPSGDVFAFVQPLPEALVQRRPKGEDHFEMVPPTPAQVDAWFNGYPTLVAAGPPADILNVQPVDLDGSDPEYGIRVRWALDRQIKWGASGEWFSSMTDVVGSFTGRFPSSGLALPAVGGNSEPQHPLITWWIVLYGLSMLARYHSRAWSAMLDVDKSACAVPLQRVLEVAHRRVPVLLLDALIADESS